MGLFAKLFGLEPVEAPLHLDDDTFDEEVLRSKLPVVVDAWGPGCAPCKQLEPTIVDLARRYRGRVKVAELNIAAAPLAARKLGVRSTPTVVYVRDGREVERVVGLRGAAYHDEIVRTELLDEGAGGE